MAENKYQAGGKPMPRTVQDFLNEIQNRGFDVKLSRRGEDKGTPKTWLIRWRGIAVGQTVDGLWTKKDPRLFVLHFARGKRIDRIVARAPDHSTETELAQLLGVDAKHLRVRVENETQKNGTKVEKRYLHVRDEAAGFKILDDFARFIVSGQPLHLEQGSRP